MSQLATFNFLPEDKTAFLGLWSMLERRFFRKPICHFSERLSKNLLREYTYNNDGLLIALVFGILEIKKIYDLSEEDPVAKTLRKRLGVSCWILKHSDINIASRIQSHWGEQVKENLRLYRPGNEIPEISMIDLNDARIFVMNRILEIGKDETLLVMV